MIKAAHNILLLLLIVCFPSLSQTQSRLLPQTIEDTAFWQEYHEPHPVGKQAAANEVRSIVADDNNNIWIATAAGIFVMVLLMPLLKTTREIYGVEPGTAYILYREQNC